MVLAAAARVLRNAASFCGIIRVLRCVSIGSPLPDIADHVMKAVSVGGKGTDRRGALAAIGREVLLREGALPSVRHVLAARRELVAQANSASPRPPSAANSYSASVGNSLPAQTA